MAAASAIAAGCTNYDSEISRLDDRIDRIEDTRINTISQQITSINNSIPQLEKMDSELKSYIESLRTTVTGLSESIDRTGTKIDEVKEALDKAIADAKAGDNALKEELVKSLETAKTDILNQLNSVKTGLEGRLGLIESAIITLQTRDDDIEKKIDDLKDYVKKEISDSLKWVSATFATIDQYNSVVKSVNDIRATVDGLSASVAALESNLKDKVGEEIEKALEPIRGQIADDVLKSVQESVNETVSKLKSDIETAYRAEIKTSLEDLDSSLKKWVNTTLDGYSTVTQTDAKLEALKAELEGKLSSQKTYLEGLINALSTDLTTKITANSTLIGSLSTEIANVNEDVKKYSRTVIDNTTRISEISQTIVNNTGTITGNSKLVEELKNRIDSLQTEMNTKISDLESKITLSTGGTDKETVIREMDKIRTEYSEKISNLQTVVEGKIAENKVQIDGNTEQIEANTKAIAENAAAITELKAKIEAGSGSGETDANAEKIAENTQKIADNAKAIADQAKLIAENASAITDNAAAIADNTKRIAALEQSLADTGSEITEAYKDAIKTAINELDGRLTGDAAAKVIEINDRITSEVKTVNETIDALTKRVATLENEMAALKEKVSGYDTSIGKINDRIDSLEDRISEIIKSVISISHVPTYPDGIENVTCSMPELAVVPGSFTLKFEIQPDGLAGKLASAWSTALSVQALYTRTRAASGDFVNLTVSGAESSGNVLSVTVSAEGLDNLFFYGILPASARLKISDGTDVVLSEYVQLKPYATSGGYEDSGINWGLGTNVDGIVWAPVNREASYSNDFYGGLYKFASASCPSGWRLPAIAELQQLKTNSSTATSRNNVAGMWFSGKETYAEDVPAVFLPFAGFLDSNGNVFSRYKAGVYRSSTSDYISINSAWTIMGSDANLLSVRCVKK